MGFVGLAGMEGLPFPSPRTREFTPRKPKRTRKYQDNELTQVTASESSSMPRCSIPLNATVNGNGTLTAGNNCQSSPRVLQQTRSASSPMTKPEKKWLTQVIMMSWGMTMVMLFFSISIMFMGSSIAGFISGLSAPSLGWERACQPHDSNKSGTGLGEGNLGLFEDALDGVIEEALPALKGSLRQPFSIRSQPLRPQQCLPGPIV